MPNCWKREEKKVKEEKNFSTIIVKKIKKIFGFIVCVILVFYYIVPFFVGKSAEKEFGSMVKNLENQLDIKIESKYNRGWFSSTANLSFNIQKAVTKLNPTLTEKFPNTFLNSDYKINHGFFPFTGNFKNRKPFVPVIAVLQGNSFISNNFFNKEIKIESSVVINLDGELAGTLLFPKQRVFAKKLDELFIKIIQSEISFSVSKNLDKADFTINFPQIDISSKKSLLKAKNIKISSNFLKSKNNFPIGKTEIKINEIVLKDKKNTSDEFNFSNFSFFKNADEKNNLVFGKIKIDFDTFNIPQEKFGPADFELTFKNLNSKSLVKIQKAVSEMQHETSQMASMMFISKLTTLLPEFIKKSPEIELTKFKVVTPDGDFSGYLKAKIDGKNFVDFTKIKEDIDKVYLEANFAVPGKFAEENSLTNNFVKFVKEGENYKTDVLFEKGVLTVNGKEMKLPF